MTGVQGHLRLSAHRDWGKMCVNVVPHSYAGTGAACVSPELSQQEPGACQVSGAGALLWSAPPTPYPPPSPPPWAQAGMEAAEECKSQTAIPSVPGTRRTRGDYNNTTRPLQAWPLSHPVRAWNEPCNTPLWLLPSIVPPSLLPRLLQLGPQPELEPQTQQSSSSWAWSQRQEWAGGRTGGPGEDSGEEGAWQ